MTSSKMSTAVCVVIAFAMVEMTHAHSYMTYPQGTGSGSCRMGGEPQFSTPGTCKGPCDFSRIEGERKE